MWGEHGSGSIAVPLHVLQQNPAQTEDTIEPTTDTVTVSASAVQLGTAKKMAVRAKTTADTTDDLYEKWFDKVYIPDQEVAA